MINILIIDDSEHKFSITQKFLLEELNIKPENIKYAGCINEARLLLYNDLFDLLLLDLVLPIDSESEPTPEDSLKFLDEIYYNSRINTPSHIIGFSEYENLIEQHSPGFLDRLWHLIPFNFKESGWKDHLRIKINHLISTKDKYLQSLAEEFQYDIGIICALAKPEFSAVKELNIDWKQVQFKNDPSVYYAAKITTLEGNTLKIIACSVNKMGMQASAVISTMMVTKFSLKFLFMTGICAGLNNTEFNFGDIIIAENIMDYGSGKMITNDNGEAVIKPEITQYQAPSDLINKVQAFIDNEGKDKLSKFQMSFRGTKPSTILKAKIGPMASGAYVVANSAFAQTILNQNRKTIGLDMEGYSIYLTTHFLHNCKGLVIKSICDFANEDKSDDFQEYSSFTSANFLHQFIINYL